MKFREGSSSYLDMMCTTQYVGDELVYRDYKHEDLPDEDEIYTCTYCNVTQKLEDALSTKHRVRPGCVCCGAPVILVDRS